MNVLVIPEDFRKDQYVLAPILEAVFAQISRPRTRIRICTDPVLGGVSEALKWGRLKPILERYKGMIDLFLLMVDRDGKVGRRSRLTRLEKMAADAFGDDTMIAEMAIEEIEVWALGGLTLPKGWKWQDIRSELNPKETYFLPLAKQRDLLDEPGEGRKSLARESARNYKKVRSRCPELVELEERIQSLR